MLYTLPNPYGIDFKIQAFQIRLYNKLKTLWGLGDDDYNSFGRVYRNATADGYIPEYYDAAKQCYITGKGDNSHGGMFYEDTIPVVSFMGLVDPIGRNSIQDDMVNVQLMFFLNLDKITAGGLSVSDRNGQRMDEVAINDVKNYIHYNGNGFNITNTYKDIDKVLERYSGATKKSALRDDMHPKFCFRLDMQVLYNPNLNIPKSRTAF